MGNKTRKQHNQRSKVSQAQRKGLKAALELEFPFVAVDHLQMAFGLIPNYAAVLQACPREFRDYHNSWNEAAMHVFYPGITQGQAAELKFRSEDKSIRGLQWAYFRTWLGSFEPKHEDKGMVCGWLLSLMLVECPTWHG